MKFSEKTRTSEALLIYGPACFERLIPLQSTIDEIEAKYLGRRQTMLSYVTPGFVKWLCKPDFEVIRFGPAMGVNMWVVHRLLTVRSDWSKK